MESVIRARVWRRRNTQGVRIVSNSYGCKTSDTPDCYSANFEQAINSFNKQGGLFVVSAGNDGVSNAQVSLFTMQVSSQGHC